MFREQNWTILADDLTGACDTGVAFARRGWTARAAFSPQADFGRAAVRVITTETRALAEDAAVQAVEGAVRTLKLGASSLVYKKVDSTLRGHPVAELAAVMRAAGIDRALVTPAFPGQGRQVRGGQVWVHGVPLADTEFARDVEHPDLLRGFGMAGSHAAGFCRGVALEDIRQGMSTVAGMLQEPGVFVADAETDTDLALLIQAAQEAGIKLLCGSAGLARALADAMPEGEKPKTLASRRLPVLVVAGSRSLVTLSQVEMARQAGVAIISPGTDDLRVANPLEPANLRRQNLPGSGLPALVAGYLSQGENVIIDVSKIPLLAGGEASMAAGLSTLTAAVLSAVPIGGLVLTGGETAAAVLQGLNCTAFDLGGEIQPGVVWGLLADGPYAGLPVVTKAGGFGGVHTLVQVINTLHLSERE